MSLGDGNDGCDGNHTREFLSLMLGVRQLGATVRLRIIEGLGLSDRVQLEEVRGEKLHLLGSTSALMDLLCLPDPCWMNHRAAAALLLGGNRIPQLVDKI